MKGGFQQKPPSTCTIGPNVKKCEMGNNQIISNFGNQWMTNTYELIFFAILDNYKIIRQRLLRWNINQA